MAAKITRFHASNLGSYGTHLPTDSEGYVHLTARGWRMAGETPVEAKRLAELARELTAEAEAALDRRMSR